MIEQGIIRKSKSPYCSPGFQIDCTSDKCKKVDPTVYQSVVGELMWLALTTRPDILHSVSKLAQRNQNPHAEHMAGIKHILRYLSSTVDVKLHYQQCGQSFCGYVDPDWAGDRLDRKSYTGYIYLLAGGPVSWRSEKQRSVALSSTEAEYMALSAAFKEAIVMRRLILEIGCGDDNTPIVVYGDNLSAQALTKNPVNHSRTKHIDISYHFVRDVVKEG
ncbi:secreted RxLR effector protein 161-like [Drosophila santomea]|uniref:secreted RxLR effector protein 161-like n=1 Tax=Drosophila santomea TaxID=129105 RepID=UPI001CCEB73E|nr:secreted RxLR effector protein 161-like [Drosophila santomea]